MRLLLLFFILPLVVIAQNEQDQHFKDVNFLLDNCNSESLNRAKEVYKEIKAKEEPFNFELKNFYEFLEYTKCKKYNDVLISAWKNDKIISRKSFKRFFKNSKENYNDFITGFSQKGEIIFADSKNDYFETEIDLNFQTKILKYIKSVSEKDYRSIVLISLKELNSSNLKSFISSVKSLGILEFKNEIIQKIYEVNSPSELGFLIPTILDLKADKLILEKILTEKQSIWDKGSRSEKIWVIIKKEGLKVSYGDYYTVNKKGKKKYDIEKFIVDNVSNNIIGNNPLLIVNNKVLEYDKYTLTPTLSNLDIKDIQTTSKHESKSIVYNGKTKNSDFNTMLIRYKEREKDGVLKILTHQ